jgi:hypothetical protein
MARRRSRTKFQWNLPGFQEARRLPGVDEALQSKVDEILDKVGTRDYDGGVDRGRTRSRGYVVTTTYDAMLREHWDHVLLKAMGGTPSRGPRLVRYTTRAGKVRMVSPAQAAAWQKSRKS